LPASHRALPRMARLPRLEVAGWPHLVVQRVHEGQFLARDDTDRQALLAALRDAARLHGLAIHAYAVCADHLRPARPPRADDSLSLTMQALGRRYVAAFNRRHARQGSLWSGRFRATVLDPAQFLLPAMRFVEQHAVRAGLVQREQDDVWSSAAAPPGVAHRPPRVRSRFVLGTWQHPLRTGGRVARAAGRGPGCRRPASVLGSDEQRLGPHGRPRSRHTGAVGGTPRATATERPPT